MEIEALGDDRKLRHVLLTTAGMRADEIRDYLLTQVFLGVDAVENLLELFKERERRLAHEPQHTIRRVLWSHLQTAADMFANQLAGVLARCGVGLLVLALVQQQVVAHATANETLLYARQGIDGMIHLKQPCVVGYQVGAHLRVDARRALAHGARLRVAPVHAVHVG